MVKYHFVCACGCGQVSDDLGKDNYIRLRKGQKWYTKECAEDKDKITPFKNGYIVKESDF